MTTSTPDPFGTRNDPDTPLGTSGTSSTGSTGTSGTLGTGGTLGGGTTGTTGSGGTSAGAGERTQQAASTAKEQASDVAHSAAQAGQHVAQEAKAEAGAVVREARRQTRRLLEDARGELTTQASGQQRRFAGTARTFGSQLSSMADSSPDQGAAVDVVAEVGSRVQALADWLEQREPGDVLDEVRAFARRRPGVFLLAAAGAGLVVGRLARGLKDAPSSSDSARPLGTVGTAGTIGAPTTTTYPPTYPATGGAWAEPTTSGYTGTSSTGTTAGTPTWSSTSGTDPLSTSGGASPVGASGEDAEGDQRGTGSTGSVGAGGTSAPGSTDPWTSEGGRR
ncbi:hypothetical protein [Cellulomonas fimi]|uniref:Uncharacterized protein n=1 Tax=Cellulomonas fimi (strain ATCC 484 / DSM 20113 / JCM 1341 / CCUG 24087 / LMG 16345 / NBRC 15513 / NCIMB 8980 / NCTC 7547 / NRS-133) TaxID=590998 RepID=F4H3C0_CELFA|nr:hypothetical protein [Cellulomonas fimi]AEE45341.1 hypothetical protein Celf_1206 [Cellulomonas fimi ATCC 484]NNH08178.1 hypothetical protein [Cellulomonas fimi]VEH29031.1 Uncharacterised protein [Cellulomonas fimi]